MGLTKPQASYSRGAITNSSFLSPCHLGRSHLVAYHPWWIMRLFGREFVPSVNNLCSVVFVIFAWVESPLGFSDEPSFISSSSDKGLIEKIFSHVSAQRSCTIFTISNKVSREQLVTEMSSLMKSINRASLWSAANSSIASDRWWEMCLGALSWKSLVIDDWDSLVGGKKFWGFSLLNSAKNALNFAKRQARELFSFSFGAAL